MHTVHWPSLPWSEQRSPSGKFHSYSRNLSLALGGIQNVGTWGGGHPFDVQERRVPPGAAVCPFHAHLAQWELFLVRAGEGVVRVGGEKVPVRVGDVWIHPPGEAHQLINSGSSDLHVLIVADHPPLDAFHYPDSNKWGLRPPGGFFHLTPADYFDGEDPRESPGSPAALVIPPPATAFSTRFRSVDSIPWDTWESPRKKFRGTSRELSIALGAARNTPTGLGGHPFDLEWGRLAPGECGCPFHSHSAQWECYLFLEGQGRVRTESGLLDVKAGDLVLHPPGEAHQFTAAADRELVYLLIADNPPIDTWHYPDSNKWGFRAPRKIFRLTEADYWDGEE
jgi:uncharacterized cupin superfamily protein